MKKFFIFCLLLAVGTGFSQNNVQSEKTDKSEWDALDKVFIKLIESLLQEDKNAFKTVCYGAVDCIDCVGKPEFNEAGNFVTSEVFYLNIAKNFDKSPVYKALVKRGYTFSTIIIKDFKSKYLPTNYPKDLKLYEVWIPTYLANELSEGHPGSSHAFQFVKINGEFKLYGMTSIP